MTLKTVRLFLLWIGTTMMLILVIDFLLSLYKITEFREAITDTADFGLVFAIYLTASFAAAAICFCCAISLVGDESKKKRTAILLKVGIGLNGLLLLLNSLPLQHWSNLALERKNFSLIVSGAIGAILFWWTRRPESFDARKAD